jgi:hypothetical protein
VGSLAERTDQGICRILTRVYGSEDLPANRRSSRGLDPGVSGWPEVFELLLSAWLAEEVVETRRLELLTLSLQRRCSAS